LYLRFLNSTDRRSFVQTWHLWSYVLNYSNFSAALIIGLIFLVINLFWSLISR
jgi:hypothetical protein